MRAAPDLAFEALYRREAPHVYRYTLALLSSQADAEEVTQTAFLNAYRAIQRGERPRNPGAWLRAIALNLCRQRFRQAARRPSEVPLHEDVADVVADDQAPTLDDLTRALKHLPFNQRAALVMREFEGSSPGEIAQALDLSTSAVEALLFRARRSLREQLEGSLTCQQAERALSLQLDGLLPRSERGALRAHLRECAECAHLARGLRAQRGAMKSLALLPLPSSLAWASQSGAGAAIGASVTAGAPVAGSLTAKLVAGALATTVLVGGGGYEGFVQHSEHAARAQHHRAPVRTHAAPDRARRVTVAVPARLLLRVERPQPGPERKPHVAGGHRGGKPHDGRRQTAPSLIPVAAEPREIKPPKTQAATPKVEHTHRTSAPEAPRTKLPNTRTPKTKAPTSKLPKTKTPNAKPPKTVHEPTKPKPTKTCVRCLNDETPAHARAS